MHKQISTVVRVRHAIIASDELTKVMSLLYSSRREGRYRGRPDSEGRYGDDYRRARKGLVVFNIDLRCGICRPNKYVGNVQV